jgi:hypothetical protein
VDEQAARKTLEDIEAARQQDYKTRLIALNEEFGATIDAVLRVSSSGTSVDIIILFD